MFSVLAVETNSGDYVLYKDFTFASPSWVGFLKYDDATYASMLYTPSERRRICVLFSVSTDGKKMELMGQNLTTKIDLSNNADVEAVNYLMQLLPDLYKWGISAEESKTVQIKGNQKKFSNIAYLNGTITVNRVPTVPLFGIESITGTNSGKKVDLLKLVQIGTVNNDTEFFNLVLPHEKEQEPSLKLDTKAKKLSLRFAQKNIVISEQWVNQGGNFYLLDNSALLTITELQNAQNIPVIELVKLFCTSDSNRTVLLDKLVLTGTEKKLSLVNEIYDTQTQAINIDKKYVFFSDNQYTIVSLTVKKADYYAHKKYFDSLF